MKSFKQFLSEQEQTLSTQPKQETKKVCDINGICEVIKTYESAGNEEKILSPYADSKGLLTIGHGHLITKESPEIFKQVFSAEQQKNSKFVDEVLEGKKKLTPEQADMLLKRDVSVRLPKVEKMIPNLAEYEPKLQAELASEYFRGMLGQSPKTVKLINQGQFDLAADEFLNSKDYRESVKQKTGIAPRMQNLSNALKAQSEIEKKKKEEEIKRAAELRQKDQ